ncbi:MAG: diguanylate cyclase [Actinobacteria bacterium]|nr:MAG: diguanylate cyclase [Actinomycetota bacterium]
MTVQAANTIENHIDYLSRKWLEAVLKDDFSSSEARVDDQEVHNILVQILKALAVVLDKKEYLYLFEKKGTIYKKARVLGELRRAQGYQLGEVLQEYIVLRKEVWSLLRRELATKDIDIFEIEERINFCLMSVLKATIESFHHRQTKDLNRLAITDSLTGLFNRRQFDCIIEQERYRADRYKRPLSFALLDIDHFKMFNDTYGHQAGDIALEAIATLIRRFLRVSDTAARYGGEEIAIVLPEVDEESAFKVSDRIRRAVERYNFINKKNKRQLTVSVGLSSYPKSADNVASLISTADAALYKAKSAGRNKVVRFSRLKEKTGTGWFAGLRAK